jgi:hypothetical protein
MPFYILQRGDWRSDLSAWHVQSSAAGETETRVKQTSKPGGRRPRASPVKVTLGRHYDDLAAGLRPSGNGQATRE